MIKLSKKGWYALKAVIHVAKSKELVHITDISASEKISLSMLRRIVPELEKAGILETTRGRTGWITLGKKVHQISVYDILFAIGEELWVTDCTKWLECENQNQCSTESLVWNLQKGFNTLLHIYTLDKIIK